MKRLLVLATALLQGCVYLPRTVSAYDERCNAHYREMTLQPYQIAQFAGSCHHRGCAYLLAALGAVTAASVVVSGSIVVAGNVVYWFEKQGQCLTS
ncbi:MAG TPA: hypothetical protein VEX61_02020 [Burkholderiales bacterium]|nr:hypothetical protein [Burkholderiales bacterium]